MDSCGFADLVQQAEQLTAEMDSGGELPRVERSLHQIMEAAQRMAARAPLGGTDSTDVKACLLLGSQGYDIQKISRKLEGLSATKTFEPLEPVRDTDIQGFLRNERENALLAIIEQTSKNTFEETERQHWESLESEWECEKQKLLHALVGSGQEGLDYTVDTESMINDSVSMQGRSAMDNVEMAYARQVYMYNEHVISGGVLPSLSDMLAEVGETLDDKNVSELWSMVHHMTDVPTNMSAGSIAQARSSTKLQAAHVTQAQKYLEQSYVSYISQTIYSNLATAQLGGIPGTFHSVRSFLNIKLPSNMPGFEDGLVEGHPVWAMIYYCLRCGDLPSAMQAVESASQNLGDFPAYLKEYLTSEERRLGDSSETKLRLQYRRSVRHSHDPYKRAVYCVIGRCDPKDDHSEIADKIDDYLWLKLSQLSYDGSDASAEGGLTLNQLQTMLLEEYGESHFCAYDKPYLYFQVLFLTAQFEAAIEFLSRVEKLRCHAVHIALVLFQLNMLLLPASIHTQLLSHETADAGPLRRLNFARLVMMYTRKFEATDPREALQYFYFLRDLKKGQGENLFMSCVSELVLETREFEMLLGQLGRDGCRKPGAIDKFHGDTQKIIELVAMDTENKGLFEDAVKLYDLAGKHDKVLELLNKLLTQVLSQAPSPQSTKDRLKNLAVSIAQRYRSHSYEGSRHTTSTFYLLLDLMTFFDLYHTQKTDQAYTVMNDLKLLPFTVESVDQKVNAFRHYTDEVRRSMPEILLATMNILYTQYKNAKSTSSQSAAATRAFGLSRKEDGGKETFINFLRSQARALITFAGMIPYRMPGDTNARLVQMEVLMN